MERNKKDNREEQQQTGKEQQPKKKAATFTGRSATSQVDPHSNSGLAQTGTNVSYEGPTAPGGGGSAGTGYGSGKSATGSRINADSEYNEAQLGKKKDENRTDNNDI